MHRAREVGERVAYFRQRVADDRGRPLTVQGLSDRCSREGLELSRPVLSKLEKGFRQSVTVDEVIVIARALGVAPIMLLFPLGQAETVEVLPGQAVRPFDAMQWFAGEVELADGPDGHLIVIPVRDGGDYGLFRSHQRLIDHLTRINDALGTGASGPPYVYLARPGREAPSPDDSARREIEDLAIALVQIRNSIREHGFTPPSLPARLAGIDPQPVAAAIVTSAEGILVGRRNDGSPPWTFIAGEVDDGERPEDAAVREVKEEAALEVEVGERIGQRIHPQTGKYMIYLAARPTRGTDVYVGDRAELADVRWAGLDEALLMMPDMFGPVREHLTRELGKQ
jgi:8-oxo-dGTP pyrophosphatase MutT (NUDIX family)